MKVYYDSDDDTIPDTVLSGIVEFPDIKSMLDVTGVVELSVDDFEGALYSTWKDYDYIEMAITDGTGDTADFSNENCIFRGFLTKKVFSAYAMDITISGLSVKLEWIPIQKNYILEEGKVKTVPTAGTTDAIDLEYVDTQGDDQDFAWDDDYWTNDRDTGILIVDNSNDISEVEWTADTNNPTCTNGTEITGDKDSLDTSFDGDTYNCKDTSDPFDMIVSVPVDTGTEIDDTNTLHKIEVELRFGIMVSLYGGSAGTTPYLFEVQLSKDGGSWETQWDFTADTGDPAMRWFEKTITLEKAHSELVKYVDDDDANDKWDSLEGLRFKISGFDNHTTTFYLNLDYVKATIYYHAEDIVPLMKKITDSGTSWVANADTTWTETGVAVDDRFKIGENTKTITNDISLTSGIPIYFNGISLSEDNTENVRPVSDETNEWDNEATPHYSRLDEETPDATTITATQEDDDKIEIYGMGSFDLGYGGEITQAIIKCYWKSDAGAPDSIACYLSWDDGNTWEAEKVLTNAGDGNYELATGTYSSLSYTQTDLNHLQIKIDSKTVVAGSTKTIDQVYVEITYDYVVHPFTKYMAREFKGNYCNEALKSLCLLEGTHWYEDYVNRRIVITTVSDFSDSGVDLDSTDYDFDWTYEDNCNDYSKVQVWGYSAYNIFAEATSTTSTSPNIKCIIDDTIPTISDAQEVADTQLAILENKRPAIKLTLDGVQSSLTMGKDVDITFERPTIAKTSYPIRALVRTKKGYAGYKTIIYAGMGETPATEKLAKTIREIGYLAHKAQIDRLVSTPLDLSSGVAITWADIGGADAAVNALIAATYTNAEIDALIAAIDTDDAIIYPSYFNGYGGFSNKNNYGAVLYVLFSDTNAGVAASFFVKDGGNFKVCITHSTDQDNSGKTASGKIYISDDVDGGTETWNEQSATEWDLALGNNCIQVDTFGTQFAVADNSKVGVYWIKDDNAGGAAGDMYVHNIILVRQ